MTKISILVDNITYQRGIGAEHGLSLLIEHDNNKILFDTGQSQMILHNAQKMGIDLGNIDGVVLSHGHFDHVGGLLYVLKNCQNICVYAHPGIFIERYSGNKSLHNEVGLPYGMEQLSDARLRLNNKPVQLADGIWTTGEIEHVHDFEPTAKSFFAISNGKLIHDTIPDDQSMFIEGDKGLIVIFGCAHAGVVNTLKHITALTGRENVYAVIGGMHLSEADDVRIQLTIDALEALNIQKLIPMHCTGFKAMTEMYWKMGGKFILAGAGDTLEL